MRNLSFWFVLLLFAAAGMVLGVLNPQSVDFYFPSGQVHWPLSLLLALALTVGMLLALLLVSGRWLMFQWRQRRLISKLKRCEAEQVSLRQQLVEQRQQMIQNAARQVIKTDE